MADTTNDLEAAYRALQRDYLLTLPQRIVALREALAAARRGDKAAHEEARRIFHQVRGTGSSFGMPELTDAAASGETVMQELAANTGDEDRWATAGRAADAMEALALSAAAGQT